MTSFGGWIGFEWDAGNQKKNWVAHHVSDDECEEVFFNLPLVMEAERAHSGHETRHHALGQTHAGRRLFIAFTIRGSRIRVISARDMTRNERRAYHEVEKADPEV